ncbi:MAG: lipid-A-disaccharide synthase [Synechococcales bacterium]|nr:lipid-A-disaccharide synthase [Synechococcales bacterium]
MNTVNHALVDVLILSNGPGELSTWVKPVVRSLRQEFAMASPSVQLRISVVLSPCPNASGREADIARRYPEVDRVQAAQAFFPFLLWGQTLENWDWAERGVVIFLGGDALFPVVISKRLGYASVVYAEWETRWHRWVDYFAVMRPALVDQAPAAYRQKMVVVGDLMAEVGTSVSSPVGSTGSVSHSPISQQSKSLLTIGLLPGSKPAKLMQGVPLVCAIADSLQQQRSNLHFFLPVAPTLDLPTLAQYADADSNPVLPLVEGHSATLQWREGIAYLITEAGVAIELHRPEQGPAYDRLRHCTLCLTTVGANTAELGALGVPMLVLLPTNQLDAMRAWDGIPGLLANLPGIGSLLARGINRLALRRLGLLAWPNIWAGRAIVPELVGELQPSAIANHVLDYLQHPEKLEQMKQELRQVRGEPGAAHKLVAIVLSLLQSKR